jgi:polyhydroxyalkanoate synthesis regulator phasin
MERGKEGGKRMETVLQLLMEGLGTGTAALTIVRENMTPLVHKGAMSQADLDGLLLDVERSLEERRQTLIAGFQKELQRLISHLPLVSKEEFSSLERNLRHIEERVARLETKQA